MELAPVGVSLTFEVTFDNPSLHVGMSVYDNSGGSPVLIQGPLAMSSVVGNTYQGKFTPPLSRPYIIFKAVYTDSGLTTLDPNYSQGSESIIGQVFSQPSTNSTGCTIVGLVEPNDQVAGFVQC